ncbi:MAG: transcription antitermination factor NusB [Neisseriaceae bacterium]|nr:MAG: transcription antitermination factor NusB [Neisseriaceae bacterium]
MHKPKLSPRRISRSLAVQGIYFFQTNPKSVSEIEDFLQNTNEEIYTRANYDLLHYLLEMSTDNFESSLALYSGYSDRPVNEIQTTEKAILVIASIELKHNLEVPAPVIINEAIELAKLYGGEDSFKFINGLVDKLAMNLRQSEMEYARKNRHKANHG